MCRLLVILFAAAYAVALAVFAIGKFGLFGQEPDPLAAILVVVLGMPWIRLVDYAPEPWWPWLATAAPLANLAIIAAICGAIGRARA